MDIVEQAKNVRENGLLIIGLGYDYDAMRILSFIPPIMAESHPFYQETNDFGIMVGTDPEKVAENIRALLKAYKEEIPEAPVMGLLLGKFFADRHPVSSSFGYIAENMAYVHDFMDSWDCVTQLICGVGSNELRKMDFPGSVEAVYNRVPESVWKLMSDISKYKLELEIVDDEVSSLLFTDSFEETDNLDYIGIGVRHLEEGDEFLDDVLDEFNTYIKGHEQHASKEAPPVKLNAGPWDS